MVGRELRVGLVLNSSELRLSEPSLRPLLMELLSSQLQETGTRTLAAACVSRSQNSRNTGTHWTRAQVDNLVIIKSVDYKDQNARSNGNNKQSTG